MTRRHHPPLLELSQLAAGTAPDDVVEHVNGCATCQQRAELVASTVSTPTDIPVLDAAVPAELVAAFEDARVPAPARGQIWRCVWDELSVLALVWLGGEQDVTLMPVTFDVHLADHLTAVFDEERSGLGLPIGIWTALEAGASTAVLERCLADLEPEALEEVAALRAARGEQQPAGVTRGIRPGSRLDERAQYRTELDVQFRLLIAAAAWEPNEGTGPALKDVLSEAGLKPADVSRELGLGPRDVVALFQARRAPTRDELDRLDTLAAEAGAAYLPSAAARATPPEELMARMNLPRWKPRLVGAAAEWGCGEATARRQAADDARGMSVAARRGRSADVEWDEILDRVLP